jgi:hypothetical protein
LEVDHRDNPPEERMRLAELVKRYDLVRTGSSDYHGSGKPNRLAENLTTAEALDQLQVHARPYCDN